MDKKLTWIEYAPLVPFEFMDKISNVVMKEDGTLTAEIDIELLDDKSKHLVERLQSIELATEKK